jgi:TrkA domain protein
MGQGIHVQELPGIGKRYDIDLDRSGPRVSVVIRRDGLRDLYVFRPGGDEPAAVIEMSEEQSRKLGAVLSGTFFEA